MTLAVKSRALFVLLALSGGLLGGWLARGRWGRALVAAPTAMEQGPRSIAIAEDSNRDGHPDRWIVRDARGRLVTITTDRNADGRGDRVEHFGSDGRPNRTDYDDDFDGHYERYDSVSAEGRVLYSYDDRDWDDIPERWVQRGARGEVVTEWIDSNEDGVPERYRGLDARGRVYEEAEDADGDGLYEVQRTFNPEWPATQPQFIDRDDDRDGRFERREAFYRDGRTRFVLLDSDGDGERDTQRFYTASGTVLKEGRDLDRDGIYEQWRFPQPGGGSRVGYDTDGDHDIDRWDPPGAPEGWCVARCATSLPSQDAGARETFLRTRSAR